MGKHCTSSLQNQRENQYKGQRKHKIWSSHLKQIENCVYFYKGLTGSWDCFEDMDNTRRQLSPTPQLVGIYRHGTDRVTTGEHNNTTPPSTEAESLSPTPEQLRQRRRSSVSSQKKPYTTNWLYGKFFCIRSAVKCSVTDHCLPT